MTCKYSLRILFCLSFLLLLPLAASAQTVKPFVTVDAARYQPAVAPDSIVSGFSSGLTATEAWATDDVDALTPGIQLPTSLGGLRVLVNNRLAGLLYVGPSQINYIVPSDTELDGNATVLVTDDQGTTIAQGELAIATSSLNIFTHNQQGTGAPAAVFTADGATYNNVTNGDGSMNVVPPGNYLVLFGTGVRSGSDIKAFIGGVEAQVDYAGAQPQYVALDQINIKVPESLTGQGVLDVAVTDGLTTSNVVTIDVGGNPQAPSGAPVITGFSVAEVYAGQVVTITGSQLPTTLAEASVKLGTTPGQIVSTSASAMSFVVPYGAATNKVTVSNATGARKSTATLTVKTSISGTVLDGQGAPLAGVPVNVLSASVASTTDSAGRFLLTDVPRGIVQVQIDTSQFPANLGLPMMIYNLIVTEGADNEIGYPIYLPANLGASAFFSSVRVGTILKGIVEADPVVLEHEGVRLSIPSTITFPPGTPDTRVKLARLPASSVLPVQLPSGIYPSVMASISPLGAIFGDKSGGRATLTFPNPDNFPAGTRLDLYAYRSDLTPSRIVKQGTATVDETGQKIVAAAMIDLATYWFVGLPSDQVTFTNVVGTVVDSNDRPVNKARVFVRGRSAMTDQSGKFEIKGVRADNNDDLRVEVKFASPAGDPLATYKLVKAVVPGPTDAGTLQLPALPALSILLRPMEVKAKPGVAVDMGIQLSRKLSADATINLTKGDGVQLDITPATVIVPAGQTTATFKVKGDLPGKGTIVAALAANVDDATPTNSRKGFAVVYVISPAPVLNAIRPISGAPGSVFTLTGTGLGTEAQQNTVFFKQSDRTVVVDARSLKVMPAPEAELNVTLAGAVPGLRTGEAEVFVRVLRNGVPSEVSNIVKFTVTQPPAPKLETITPNTGAPGATFTLIGTGLDANPKNLGIFFKQGEKIIPSPVELLKVLVPPTDDPTKPATIQGVVPRMPAGDAEVFAVVFRNGAPSEPSNRLAFKVTTPPGPTLDSVTPTEGAPGTTFTIKGSNFDPEARRNFVFFKQGDRFQQLDPSTLKFDGQTISGVVPRLPLGGYEIIVVTNLESVAATSGKLPGTPSNPLPFKIIAPPGAKLDSIDPVESVAGKIFTIKGSGWGEDLRKFRVIFKQGDRWLGIEPANIKFDQTMITGVLPNFPAGDYEVLVVTSIDLIQATNTTPPGVPSNSLKFKMLPPPGPALETISPTEALPGTPFKLTGKNFKPGIAVEFRQATQRVVIAPEQLKVTETTIEGVVPRLPAGGAEVVAFFTAAQPSNPLSFKFLAPPGAKLDSLDPIEGKPGTIFRLKGSGFGTDVKLFRVGFGQNDRVMFLDPATIKTDGIVIEGVVPQLAPGVYAVGVMTNLTVPEVDSATPNGTPSNFLQFTVLGDPPPAPVLETITPTEGLPGAPFKLTGKNFKPGMAVAFKQGTQRVVIAPERLKVTETTIEGSLPNLPPGSAEVAAFFGTEQPSNPLPFKFLALPGAKLDSIDPVEGKPGTPFKIKGTGFGTDVKLFRVAFGQGDRFVMLDPATIKTDGVVIEGVVPQLAPGLYSVGVLTNLTLPEADGTIPGTPSNLLQFTVLGDPPPTPTLQTISPTEGAPGTPFKLTGTNFVFGQTVYFRQGDKRFVIAPEQLKFTETTIEGVLPQMPPGAAEVGILIGLDKTSNTLPFKFLAPPGAKLDSVDPTQGLPRATFALKGSGFAPEAKGNLILFKQGDRWLSLDPSLNKLENGVLSSLVPNVAAGDYEIVVMTNLWLSSGVAGIPPGVPSNGLKFTVLAPPPPPAPTLETITPTEGTPGTPFKLTGKNFPASLRVIFKQGDIVEELWPDMLKITETTIEGMLPGIPPGGAEVMVLFGQDGKSNPLPFKFLLPAKLARLSAINPVEVTPGGTFKLTGENLAPFYAVIFKQGDRFIDVPQHALKFTDGTMIEGPVPGLAAGDALVFVAYGSELSHVKSNDLPLKSLAPQQAGLESISSVTGKPEGFPGDEFKLTGKNLAPFYAIIFKQGDKKVVLDPFSYRVVDGVIVGRLPDLPPGAAEVYLAFGADGPAATNLLTFTFKPRS